MNLHPLLETPDYLPPAEQEIFARHTRGLLQGLPPDTPLSLSLVHRIRAIAIAFLYSRRAAILVTSIEELPEDQRQRRLPLALSALRFAAQQEGIIIKLLDELEVPSGAETPVPGTAQTQPAGSTPPVPPPPAPAPTGKQTSHSAPPAPAVKRPTPWQPPKIHPPTPPTAAPSSSPRTAPAPPAPPRPAAG